MENTIIIGKIDLSIFDKPEVKLPSFGIAEEQDDDDFQRELDQEDYYDSLNDYDKYSFLGENYRQIVE